MVCVVSLAALPAQGGRSARSACSSTQFSYAGLESSGTTRGVAATLAAVAAPAVVDGHVGGWIGVTGSSPGGTQEWVQAGFSAFTHDQASHMYYEYNVAGADTRYVELDHAVEPGAAHRFAVLEMARRNGWWRVWVDGKPVSPPIRLPGSHGTWVGQAIGENWNGGTGTCNGYAYRFSNVSQALVNGGVWRPLKTGHVFHDAGYRVVPLSRVPRTFVVKNAAG